MDAQPCFFTESSQIRLEYLPTSRSPGLRCAHCISNEHILAPWETDHGIRLLFFCCGEMQKPAITPIPNGLVDTRKLPKAGSVFTCFHCENGVIPVRLICFDRKMRHVLFCPCCGRLQRYLLRVL